MTHTHTHEDDVMMLYNDVLHSFVTISPKWHTDTHTHTHMTVTSWHYILMLFTVLLIFHQNDTHTHTHECDVMMVYNDILHSFVTMSSKWHTHTHTYTHTHTHMNVMS